MATDKPARSKPNVEGLLRALEDVRQDLPWIERVEITADAPIDVDANDDLKRETAFYAQALACVKESRSRCDDLGVPCFRPHDYYAEMMKDDAHMNKVKSKLLFEQKKIAAFQQRKREQEARKYAREVQAQRVKEKAAEHKGIKTVGTGGGAKKRFRERSKSKGPKGGAGGGGGFKGKGGGRFGGSSGGGKGGKGDKGFKGGAGGGSRGRSQSAGPKKRGRQ